MNKVGVSVIIPVYNQHVWMIQQAIDSCLNQTGNVEMEIVLVNDASTEHWYDQMDLTNPKIKFYTYDKNRGAGYAWDYGCRRATHSYLCPMACDDLFHPDKTEVQLALMKDQKVAFSYTGYRELFLDDNYKLERIREHTVFNVEKNDGKLIFKALIKNDYGNNFINGASVMMTRKLYEDVGGYDINIRLKNDYDLWLRVADKYKIFGVPYSLMIRRVHNNQAKRHFNPTKKLSERWLRTVDYITVKEKWEKSIFPVTNGGVNTYILRQLGYQA